ncbi:ribosomal protein S17, putative [Acanthamoeba castellanii str. Neff]|uniref:Ribosomal protein S17, putative n=1 Tax=Acanthamoeba castellanii (strain ATCC 30010 / Neff) TaxID=1257118 RepID=L8HL46_ACACF|nr:ribosomal protein S17, putative [Acanthamoeba castellanii str. Neff]ELR25398.1 ribosomal protein S17, putative [Acanthamoeba castellanii str. Neff]
MEAAQTERAFQKQPTVYVGKARVLGTKAGKGKGVRFTKNIGLGFKTPKEAIEGKYIDKKCPFTGNVSIRGRILRGVVVSTKMKRTIIVRRDYLHYVPKYNRFEKRHKNIPAHCSPAFTLKEGDVVTVGQCRPLSKTIRFNVIAHQPQNIQGLQKKKTFRIF